MDAVVLFDRNGRCITEYKLREYPSGKVASALAATPAATPAASGSELSSSQLLYHGEAFGARVAIVYGSGESPLRVESFFHNFLRVLEYYFEQRPSAQVLEANSAAVLSLLEIMLDDGAPSVTEPSLVCAMAGKESVEIEYEGHRRAATYTTEELFIDVVEHLTLELGPKKRSDPHSGQRAIQSRVHGLVNVLSRVSGPNPRVSIDLGLSPAAHVALHPCVDGVQWARQRTMLFTPPDRHSTIASYTLDSEHHGLVSAKLRLGVGPQNEFEVSVSVGMDTVVKAVDNLRVGIVCPKAKSIKETRMTAGELLADLAQKEQRFEWSFGASTPTGWEASMRGIALDGEPSYLVLSYSLIGRVPSRTSVKSVQVPSNGKKPYKGVRYRTNVDSFVVRP